MIFMTCPHCNRELNAADERAGRSGYCTHCKKAIAVADFGKRIETSHSFTRAADVSFDKSGGRNRQDVKSALTRGTPLSVRHDAGNEYHDKAMGFYTPQGEMVGHLNAELAEEVFDRIQNGESFTAAVSGITGGESDQSLGLNVLLVSHDPNVQFEELQGYIHATLQEDAQSTSESFGVAGASPVSQTQTSTRMLILLSVLLGLAAACFIVFYPHDLPI